MRVVVEVNLVGVVVECTGEVEVLVWGLGGVWRAGCRRKCWADIKPGRGFLHTQCIPEE